MSIFFHFSASDWHPPRLLPASFQPCSLPVSCHVFLQSSVYSASYAPCSLSVSCHVSLQPSVYSASYAPCSLSVSCHVFLQSSVYSASYASCLSSSFPLLICRSDTGLTAFSARNVVSPEDFCWTNRIFAPKRS